MRATNCKQLIAVRARKLLDPARVKPKTDSEATIHAQLEAMVSVVNMTGFYVTDFCAWAAATDEDFLHDAEGILNNFDPVGLGLGNYELLFTKWRVKG